MLLPTAGYFAFIFLHSEPMPPWRLLLVAYAAWLLFGGSLLALGSFISSLTESQIIAAVITFVRVLALCLRGLQLRGQRRNRSSDSLCWYHHITRTSRAG